MFYLSGKEKNTRRSAYAPLMSPSIREILASSLATHLAQREWSQSKLAEKSGVSQKTISNMLNGQARGISCQIDSVEAVAVALGVTVADLLVLDPIDSDRFMLLRSFKLLPAPAQRHLVEFMDALASDIESGEAATAYPSHRRAAAD